MILQQSNTARRRTKISGDPDATLPDLQMDSGLNAAALAHSRDMIVRRYFDHIDPDGTTPQDRIRTFDRRMIFVRTGENILKINNPGEISAEKLAGMILRKWLNSPPHRKNLLSEKYTHIGIGVASDGNVLTATQTFAQVAAFLDQPVPEIIENGTVVNFRISRQLLPCGYLDRLDFLDPETNRAAGPDIRCKKGVVSVKPGKYIMRFYFRQRNAENPKDFRVQKRSWQIFSGPYVEIREQPSIHR